MSKNQFRILSVLAGLCALLFLVGAILTPLTNRLNQTVVQTQTQLQAPYAEAQQKQGALENLLVRIGQSAQTDPVLIDLLRRYGIMVNLGPGAAANPPR